MLYNIYDTFLSEEELEEKFDKKNKKIFVWKNIVYEIRSLLIRSDDWEKDHAIRRFCSPQA